SLLELLHRAVVLVAHLRDRIGFPEQVGDLVDLRHEGRPELVENHGVSFEVGTAAGRGPAGGHADATPWTRPLFMRGGGRLVGAVGRAWVGVKVAAYVWYDEVDSRRVPPARQPGRRLGKSIKVHGSAASRRRRASASASRCAGVGFGSPRSRLSSASTTIS